jgi:hypothetical protein
MTLYLPGMLKLKIISFFLVLLMLIQILPVQQIGNALSQNQWTEELPHKDSCSNEDCSIVKAFLPVASHNHAFDFISSVAVIYIHVSEQIPSNHSTDVVSPPPDVMA